MAARPAALRPPPRHRRFVGGVVAAVLATGLGVAVIVAVAADEPRALPPPPNNPGTAGYRPATVDRPVEDTLPVGPAATSVVVASGAPSRSAAKTSDPAGAPATVSTLGPGDRGFGWPSSAFGYTPLTEVP